MLQRIKNVFLHQRAGDGWALRLAAIALLSALLDATTAFFSTRVDNKGLINNGSILSQT